MTGLRKGEKVLEETENLFHIGHIGLFPSVMIDQKHHACQHDMVR